MPDPQPDTALGPTRVRLDALDVIRGIAVLGILLMNIEEMGTPKAAWVYPPLISWTSADQVVWWLREVLAKGTMRGLLALLFGAGFILMTTRAGRDDGKVADAYYRRTIWLVLFGIVHGYFLLWPGDILLIYGVAALFLFPWRHWAPARFLTAGAVVVLLLTLIAVSHHWRGVQLSRQAEAARLRQQAGATLSSAEQDAVTRWTRRVNAWQPKPEEVKKDTDARLGGFAANWNWQFDWANELNAPQGFLYWTLDALALMFVGAALVKWGVIQGTREPRIYFVLATSGYLIGLALNLAEAWPVWSSQFRAPIVWGPLTHQISRIAVTFGHVGLILLVLATAVGRRVLHPFAAVGRLALSNYIAQTLICQWLLFPGFGLGLFGRFGLARLWLIVLAVNVVQIAASVLYLRRFSMGPLEWVLRKLAY